MAKIKRKKATKQAIESIHLKPVDAKDGLNTFISKWKNKKLWLKFSGHFFIRIKVLDLSASDVFENILIKIVEKPNWINQSIGTFVDYRRKGNEWTDVKIGQKIYVNKISLYTTEQALKIIEKEMIEKISNLSAVRHQLKFIKKSINEMEIIKKNIETKTSTIKK